MSRTAPARIPVHLVTAVWGEEYSRLFLRVLVPSMLTPGNLPALCASMDAVCRVYTLAGERARFEGTPELERLRAVVPVEVIEVVLRAPDATHNENIGTMVQLHRRSIEDGERAGAAMVFLSPDMLFADGSFATLARLAASGKRAVMIPGLRLVREDFLAEYPRALEAAGRDGLKPRALVALALRHLHPLTRALIWGGPTLANGPSMLLWKVGEVGLLGRYFHLHPLYVHPERRGSTVATSVDDAYVANACPDPSTVAVIDDSDDLVAFELTSKKDVEVWWRRVPRSVLRVAIFASMCTTPLHREHFLHPIVIRAAEGSPLDWWRARTSADVVARAVLLSMRLGLPALTERARRGLNDARNLSRAAVTAGVVLAKSALGIDRTLFPDDDREPRPPA